MQEWNKYTLSGYHLVGAYSVIGAAEKHKRYLAPCLSAAGRSLQVHSRMVPRCGDTHGHRVISPVQRTGKSRVGARTPSGSPHEDPA